MPLTVPHLKVDVIDAQVEPQEIYSYAYNDKKTNLSKTYFSN